MCCYFRGPVDTALTSILNYPITSAQCRCQCTQDVLRHFRLLHYLCNKVSICPSDLVIWWFGYVHIEQEREIQSQVVTQDVWGCMLRPGVNRLKYLILWYNIFYIWHNVNIYGLHPANLLFINWCSHFHVYVYCICSLAIVLSVFSFRSFSPSFDCLLII